MANILDQITIGDQRMMVVDADPTIAPGLSVPVGCIAMFNNAGVGQLYFNPTGTALGWELLSPSQLIVYGAVSTISSSQGTLATLAIPQGVTVEIEVLTQAIRTGGSAGAAGDGAAFSHVFRVKNVSGAVTIGAVDAIYTDRDNSAYVVTFGVFAQNIAVFVNSPVNVNADWKCTLNYQMVS